MTSHELTSLIKTEAAARNIAPATLCRLAVGNNRLYRTLTDGGTCTLEVAERFRNFINTNPSHNTPQAGDTK